MNSVYKIMGGEIKKGIYPNLMLGGTKVIILHKCIEELGDRE